MEKLRKLLLIACICIFAYSAFNLGKIFYDYYVIDKETNEMKDTYVKDVEEKEIDPLKRVIDFKALKKRNKDVIGWLYIPGTNIDEVIMKGANNDTYLRHTIDHEYSIAGEVFIEEFNSTDFTDTHTIIYGHNMHSGARFSDIKEFLENDYFEENKNVYIYTPDGNVNVYKIYVARTIDANSDMYSNNQSYDSYVKTLQSKAQQVRKVSSKEAPLIMCSTCVNSTDDTRYIIGARLSKTVKIKE